MNTDDHSRRDSRVTGTVTPCIAFLHSPEVEATAAYDMNVIEPFNENGHGHDPESEDEYYSDLENDSPETGPVAQAAAPAKPTRSNTNMSGLQWKYGVGLVPAEEESFANLTEAGANNVLDAIALLASCDPVTVTEALTRSDSMEWKRAMQGEMEALNSQNAWTLVPRPAGRKVIKTKWVFRLKYRANGEIDKYKARFCAKGFSQKKGIDYQEVFSPVIRFDTVRFLFAVIAERKYKIKQIDVVGAFLYGELDETIFIEEPEGFETSKNGETVCKLNKSLYGLKQSPRQWNKKFHQFLVSTGLTATESDACLYTNESHDVFFALYVDDGLVAAATEEKLTAIISEMKRHFQVTVGEAEFFVGLQIERQPDGGVFIHQEAYTTKIVERFGMSTSHPVETPADAYSKIQFNEAAEIRAQDFPYRELIGSIMFLMVGTRPDISYIVSALSQYLDKPQEAHWKAGKRVLRYLNGTRRLGIMFSGKVPLTGFCDADFAGDEDSRHSRSGMVFTLNGGPVTWQSQKQSTLSTSTCEAELAAAFTATKEAIWLKRLLADIGSKDDNPVPLFVDNQGTIKYIRNPLSNNHKRSKHWDVRYKFTKEMQEAGQIDVQYVHTTSQLADVFTKALPPALFTSIIRKLTVNQSAAKFSSSGSVVKATRT